MSVTGCTSFIRCCPVTALVGVQQLLAGQLNAIVQQFVVSRQSSLDYAGISQRQLQQQSDHHPTLLDVHHQNFQPAGGCRHTRSLPRLGLLASSVLRVVPNRSSSCDGVAGLWQVRRHYARPCSEAADDEPSAAAAAAANPSRRRRGRTTNSSDAAAPTAAAAAADGVGAIPAEERPAGVAADFKAPVHEGRTTESKALLRRTTESRAAIEDVAVMNKSQLTRRNKAWLQHECWSRKLPYDGLKPDLVQQLLDWQQTDAGRDAAAAALASAEAERAAAAAAAGAGPRQELQESTLQQPDAAAGSIDSSTSTSSSRRRRRSTSSAATTSSSRTTEEDQLLADEAAAAAAPIEQPQQPPRNAAAAAADSLTVQLQQLQDQPGNAALLAVARNSLELHVKSLMASSHASSSSSSSSGSSWLASNHIGGLGSVAAAAAAASADAAARTAALEEAAADLASRVQSASSPASIAVLAAACYSREVQSAVLAAAMSEVVAAVAPQLGPQEVYRVLRLLVEHLGGAEAGSNSNRGSGGDAPGAAAAWAGGEASRSLRRGFQVLAQALIGCCSALAPMQLAEAVALLARHRYDDAWGLWLISKEAADRLAEFEPCDMVLLLDAVAGMCVADDALCSAAAEAVAAERGKYSAAQLAGVANSLQRMGYVGEV